MRIRPSKRELHELPYTEIVFRMRRQKHGIHTIELRRSGYHVVQYNELNNHLSVVPPMYVSTQYTPVLPPINCHKRVFKFEHACGKGV